MTRLAVRNFRNELDEVGGLSARRKRRRHPSLPRHTDGAEYRVRILDLLKEDRTPEGLARWVDDTIEQANLLFPDPAMRKSMPDRDITTEVSNYLLGRDNLPKVMGRKLGADEELARLHLPGRQQYQDAI